MDDLLFARFFCCRGLAFLLLSLGAVLLVSSKAWAEGASATAITPGIYFSQQANRQFSSAEKDQLLVSLRRLTGWTQLRVDARDCLLLERANESVGGSLWARRVIRAALRSGHRFLMENHADSVTVNFGQLDEGTTYEDPDAGLKLTIFRVRLDFVDFQKMEASPAVRAAFDEGFTFLHELLHGLGWQDTDIPNEIGDCEQLVNKMRTELGVPLRDHYLGDVLLETRGFRTVRVRFKQQEGAGRTTARWKKHYLFFVMSTAVPAEPRRKLTTTSRTSQEKILSSLAE